MTELPIQYLAGVLAQRPEAVLALEAGLQRFPPARGNVDDQMAALGWALPTAVGQ